ncbi:hypothetical protein CEXT_455341 [Caerostris extrusa]|uniref:Uncharacterized protein n=1 Tax=Caerostris extrusa TaxID=172846 RepID=A0AAV4W4U8_CAEEX|nr:hypothetical protein CEXT_455341 [Caerostris extrusa]
MTGHPFKLRIDIVHAPFTRAIWSLSTSITMSSDSPGRAWSRLLCIQNPSSLKPIYLSERKALLEFILYQLFRDIRFLQQCMPAVLRFLDEFISSTKRRKT